ncbi:CHAD domain-containing protein [Sulfolobus sp. E5-1-F]|uniref:CHAD domain-containing protein n=1 Tax=Saccharolobus sp. E5-1-F TaxID=2663019 RepID=UPI001295E353|nr:CHAD domain-containing protein [Sulfolobus sp. E5-1-F]QGA53707.1 CHAD domain-containing protein [Sulfolobus sp. E5-1-F]
MTISRVEDYLNLQLKKALQINGISIEEIHDIRVAVRKYFDVLYTIHPVYENVECLFLAKEVISKLGKVRDMDICEIINEERDKLAIRATKEVRGLKVCFINNKIYGARLVIYNRILSSLRQIQDITDFHELRKNVRVTRNLIEALGYDNTEIKALAKKMGDIRDEMLKMRCRGVTPPDININQFKEEAKGIILKIIASQDEFHHFKIKDRY